MIASILRPLFLTLACVLATGCAQKATIRKLQPARLNVSSQRLGVVNVPASREEAALALEELRTKLSDSGVSLVDQDELQRAAAVPLLHGDGGVNVPAAVEAASRLGLDSLLITKVRFVEADGSVYGSKSVRFGDPKVTAEVSYKFVDVRSGNVLDRNTVQADYCRDEMDSGSESKVLSRLAKESGVKLANVFIPHESLVDVQLAHAALGPGSTDVRIGSQAAKEGDWQLALTHWHAAVQADEKNDAALYNCGLAHEALGDLTQARQNIESALAISPSSLYRQALARVEQNETDLRVARSQQSSAAFVSHATGAQGSTHPQPHWKLTRLPAP